MVEKVNEEEYQYESYDFIDFEVSVWVENDHIRTIRCDKFCFFRQQNLIKMKYQDFLSLSGIYPDSSENIYLLVNNRGQNQKVHTFERSGLQIWVWRNKIVTVLISNYQLEEFYS